MVYRAPTLGNCAKLNGAEDPSATLKLLSYTKREYATRETEQNTGTFSERFLAQVGRGLPAPPAI